MYGIYSSPSPCNQGFTLLEMLTAMTLIGILLALGIPSYQNSTQNSQLYAKVTNFTQALRYARSEAIATNKEVTVCASTDFLNCSGDSDWAAGWIICSNCTAADKNILRVGDAPSSDIRIFIEGLPDNSTIVFAGDGTLSGSGGRGTFHFCDSRGAEKAKALILNGIGRTQDAYDSDGDNILEDHNGVNISC